MQKNILSRREDKEKSPWGRNSLDNFQSKQDSLCGKSAVMRWGGGRWVRRDRWGKIMYHDVRLYNIVYQF